MKSKLRRLQESIGDNSELLNNFVETFGDLPDSAENLPTTDLLVEQFCDENSVELIEAYDISSLNLKKGTIIEMTELEDVLNLTKGKFKKELALFLNDNGVISIKVVKDGADTINGIKVEVSINGDSQLANGITIKKELTNTLENGDLSFLTEEDLSMESTSTPMEKMSLVEMIEGLSPEEMELVVESCKTGEKQRMSESLNNVIDGVEIDAESESKLLEAVAEFYQYDTPEGMIRQQPIDAEAISAVLEAADHNTVPTEQKGVYLVENENGEVCGLYNNNTGNLDCYADAPLVERIKEAEANKLMEAAEQVRVANISADKFRDMLKGTGVDFSRVSKGGSFEDFFINGKSKSEIKAMIDEFMSNGGKAIMVERIKEGNYGDGNKGYIRVIIRNPVQSGLLKMILDDMDVVGYDKGISTDGKSDEFSLYYKDKKEYDTLKKALESFKKNKGEARIMEAEDSVKPQEYADVIVENAAGEILMLQRNSTDAIEPSKFGLAGGKIEEGETPEEAAKRELFEETGIEAEGLEPINQYTNPDGTISHYFKATTPAETVTLTDEHEGMKWVKPTELAEMENVMFENNERFCEVCGVEKSPLVEGENKVDVGSTVKDVDGKEWKAEEITDEGFKMTSDGEEKLVKFADIDSFLGTVPLKESIKVKNIYKLKESVDPEAIVDMIKNGELDTVMDNVTEAESDDEDKEFLADEMTSEDPSVEIITEADDEFGDTVSLVKDDVSDQVYVVESRKC